ncbi:MAG TPA: LacI family DNA-binding transcriptional regulator [Tepidisphaeraceae bacterium]|nr:LacI family DNA-binding transcriptional regulator [Tepidisphaeraceae bacterium]
MPKSGGSLMEVARRCAVSQSTVSRVLNNSKHGRFSVSPKVRAKILKVANELNYRPSIAARNLAVNKTRLVAVLGISEFGSDRVGPVEEALGSLARSLDAAGYEICMQFVSFRRDPFDLPMLRVDGVVAVAPRTSDHLEKLEASGIPYVSIDGIVGNHGLQVLPDDADGMRKALEHLVSLGHRRIAYLDNPTINASHLSVFVRRQTFADAREEMGFDEPTLDLPRLPADAPWDSYYRPFLRRAVVEGRATAVVAYSHFGAMALVRTAHDMGLSVPKDFSLICFNNEPVLRLAVPSITAVDVPALPLGIAAADLLLQEMTTESPCEQRQVKLPETLVLRESTAPPSK